MDLVVAVFQLQPTTLFTGTPPVQYGSWVVTKDDIGESRLALDPVMTSMTVKGIMTYHAVVCLQPVVLVVRKTCCCGPCSFYHDQFVLRCQDWKKHVLFQQHTPVPVPQLKQQTSRRVAGVDPHFQKFQGGSRLTIYYYVKNNVAYTRWHSSNELLSPSGRGKKCPRMSIWHCTGGHLHASCPCIGYHGRMEAGSVHHGRWSSRWYGCYSPPFHEKIDLTSGDINSSNICVYSR